MSILPDMQAPIVQTHEIRKAVRISYLQAMLGSIYVASTGGMFVIGYALMLGAGNVQIGLMSTFPMLCVFAQLISALLVEGGISRRGLTFAASVVNVSLWALIILIPYVTGGCSSTVKVGLLIAIITAVTFFAHISGNARSSWIGDLIPDRFRGRFFGSLAMYGGIIAAVFAVVEGAFLDFIKSRGIGAFSILFAFGMVFGLANALLFRPQRDMPVPRSHGAGFFDLLVGTFRNKALMRTMGFMLVFMLQSVAWPFYAVYQLRDLKMPFLGVGLVGSVFMVTLLFSAPFWGRVVGRMGCRPVLVFCVCVLAIVPLSWIWVESRLAVYAIVAPCNVVAGFAAAGINVGLNTLIFRVTPSAGRSVQLAIYTIVVTVAAAPMPYLGGHLPGWLQAAGIHWGDLRWTFYASGFFAACAAVMGWNIHEDGAGTIRRLLGHLLHPRT